METRIPKAEDSFTKYLSLNSDTNSHREVFMAYINLSPQKVREYTYNKL